jgi:hypothetical protein
VTRVALPAAIVLLTVASFVGAAGWNRSGEPPLVIVMTERELPIAHVNAAPGDDPGARLRIAYEYRHDPLDARNWLPESRLREIGFPLNVPVASPQAPEAYDRVPPRVAWVVFEYEGPQWRDIARRRALAKAPAAPGPTMSSRLVPVDVGLDFAALHVRYPSGHLILRALFGLSYVHASRGGPLLHGVLRDVVPSVVAVPYEFRGLVEGLIATADSDAVHPRYEVELAVGSLGLPYIRSLRAPAAQPLAIGIGRSWLSAFRR